MTAKGTSSGSLPLMSFPRLDPVLPSEKLNSEKLETKTMRESFKSRGRELYLDAKILAIMEKDELLLYSYYKLLAPLVNAEGDSVDLLRDEIRARLALG